jgi:hypothetical protein
LVKEFTAVEVSWSLSRISALKALGPDGYAACKYHKYWAIVGNEGCQAVLTYLNSGRMIDSINDIHISLFSKVKPSKVTDFRPINLCNVLYKIGSKVLENRLKKFLSHIISQIKARSYFGDSLQIIF